MRLIIEHRDPGSVSLLQKAFQAHPHLDTRPPTQYEPGVAPDVDAFYLPMPAFEQVPASALRLRIHQAHVFRTELVFPLRAGRTDLPTWPPFVISGFVTRPDEARGDPRLLPRFIQAVIVAVRRFTAQTGERIETISLDSAWMNMGQLAPQEAAQVICAAYDEAIAVPQEELDDYGRVKPHLVAMVDFVTTTGERSATEWRCLLDFQGRRCECALILEDLAGGGFGPRLEVGENEGVRVEFLCPETGRPQLTVGDAFTLWEKGKQIATGIVRQVLARA